MKENIIARLESFESFFSGLPMKDEKIAFKKYIEYVVDTAYEAGRQAPFDEFNRK